MKWQVLGTAVKTLLGMLTSHTGVPGLKPRPTSNSIFLLMETQGDSR